MRVILRMLSEKGCISYRELVEAGIPRKHIPMYALKLERAGIAERYHINSTKILCLKLMKPKPNTTESLVLKG